jgi:hypothetical protein
MHRLRAPRNLVKPAMHNTLLLMLAAWLAWTGFALLALAQERHFGHFYLSFKPAAQWIRAQAATGIIAICLSLPVCLKAQGAGFGSLLWILLITACAITVALQLTWAPKTFHPLAWLVQRFCKRLSTTLSITPTR